ncbi:MAG: glycine cleavage system protein H [Candidatus Hodarchaeota archaeon]
MSDEFLEARKDKFIFKVKKSAFYSEEGIWFLVDGEFARIGISDYKQQTIGDIGFVEFSKVGQELHPDGEIAVIETIKTVMDVLSPVNALLHKINDRLEDEPELINEDPYGDGWIAIIKLTSWEQDKTKLLSAERYLNVMMEQAEEEAKNL